MSARDPDGGISFPRVSGLTEHFERAHHAVYEASGREPTHFLVGWATLAQFWLDELALSSISAVPTPSRCGMHYRGAPLHVDPTREHAIIAVPEYDFFVGRPLPAGAVWEGP